MVNVFSLCLFGSQEKYWKGLLKNIELIQQKFTDWETWVYLGDNIPAFVLQTLQTNPSVQCIPTGQQGMINKVYRFFPIDSPNVDICIIRDTDSRIYVRDEVCIREFLKSPHQFHIIRDHPNHFHKIMAGMFGIKKGALNESIQQLYANWKNEHFKNDFWDDTHFLTHVIYPRVVLQSLIHDQTQQFEPPHMKTAIPWPIEDGNYFIGQVYEFNEQGQEIPKFNYFRP